MSQSSRLFVGLSRNVPYFEGAIGRPGNDSLFRTKEFDARNFVGVTYQVMNLTSKEGEHEKENELCEDE